MVSSKKHSSAKIKSLSGKDKFSNAREYGEGLVGSRVRVWWPLDRQFYEGVVESYASSQRKHRVLYDDGDEENLNMNKERWEFIEEDDAETDEEESADASSDATPEPVDRKKARSNGDSFDDDVLPKKKQKIDFSAKSKSKASLKKSEDSEEKRKNPKGGVKNVETSKGAEKQTPKPETVKNGKMGDIGGKIVAAASRMSERFRSKENGQDKEIPKSLKTSKKVAESNNRKQKRPSSSSEAVSEKVKKPSISLKKVKSNNFDNGVGGDDDDTSDDEASPKALKSSKKVSESKNPKQKRPSSSSEAVSEKVKKARTSSKEVKSNNSDVEESGEDEAMPKALKSSKKVPESKNPKQKRPLSSSEAISAKVEKPRISSKEVKINNSDEDDESKPLVIFLKKLKGKNEKEAGERSSGNETEVGDKSS